MRMTIKKDGQYMIATLIYQGNSYIVKGFILAGLFRRAAEIAQREAAV